MIAAWPDFIRSLPEADLPLETLRGWLSTCQMGQVLFLEVLEDTDVPEHTHGGQWGIVVEGEIWLTQDSHQRRTGPGDSYAIEAGVPHGAFLRKGTRLIDVFEDADRYQAKA